MSTPGQELIRRMEKIYNLDLASLQDCAELGVQTQRVTAMLAALTAAGERDARKKLRQVRFDDPELKSAAARRALAWLTTRSLRTAAAALRRASAQSVAYRISLNEQFIEPAKAKKQLQRTNQQRRDNGGWDVLGGI